MYKREFILKNGEPLLVREGIESDAEAAIAHLNTVGGESDFLTFGAEGLPGLTLESEREFLAARLRSEFSALLLCFVGGELACICNVDVPLNPRTHHNANIGISVKKRFWGIGVGTCAMEAMLDFIKNLGCVKYVRLDVYADNARAIRLYERFGFRKAGTLSERFFVNGVYHDEITMELKLA